MILKSIIKIIFVCGLVLCGVVNSLAQVKTVMTNNDGVVVVPSNFANKNKLVTYNYICIRIEMYTSDNANGNTNWTDVELKVLDNNGVLKYFATTQFADVVQWHCPTDIRSLNTNIDNLDEDYPNRYTDGTWDRDCKMYYYVAGKQHNSAGGCANPKKEHKLINANKMYDINSSVFSTEGGTEERGINKIIAIEFYPSAANLKYFIDPSYTVIFSRKSGDNYEASNGNRMWLPATVQYFNTSIISE